MTNLSQRTIAISISDAPDRLKLGFPRQEVDRMLLSICSALVRSGARIQYAGNLDPRGFTFKIFRHLASSYAIRTDPPPFIHLIPEPILRRSSFDSLCEILSECQSTAETHAFLGKTDFRLSLEPPGHIVATDRTERPLVIENGDEFVKWLESTPTRATAEAYSWARQQAAENSAARIALGGKMGMCDILSDHYEGVMPGVAEEAILTLDAKKPFIPFAAFGGATRDIAIALLILPVGERVERGEQSPGYHTAMERLEALSKTIPDRFRSRLTLLAREENAEGAALKMIDLIAEWTADLPPYVGP